MEPAPKKKRGRPRKAESMPVSRELPPLTKRPRGRPRKFPAPAPIPEPVLEVAPKRRGRPPKAAAPIPEKPKKKKAKDYEVISIEDVKFWAKNTERDMFIQTVADFAKSVKSGYATEIRWYKDKIEVAVISEKKE